MRRPTILQAAQAAILALTAMGWVLSCSALQALAEQHGYPGWQSWLVPLTIDLLALACALLALACALLGLACAQAGRGPTGEAWALAGVAALVTLGGNTAAAWLARDGIAVALHAMPAICMLGAWHLYFRSVEASTHTGGAAAPRLPPGASAKPPGARHGRASAQASLGRLRVLEATLGRALTTGDIVRELRVSAGHARKLRAQLEAAA